MVPGLRVETLDDAEAVAGRGAHVLADFLSSAVATRGHATLAVSGGRTPARMFELIACEPAPWNRLDIFQVDERIAPDGHPDRNATGLEAALAMQLHRRPERFHWMPVTMPVPEVAVRQYQSALEGAAGSPPVLDIVHLGLGADGHTASIFPGAPIDENADIAVTGPHLGRRRMTLTIAAINRARLIVWIVSGRDKRDALAGLLHGDPGWVASRVRRTGAVVIADRDAAASPA